MSYEKGHSKQGGRKKGTPNKTTAEQIDFINNMILNEAGNISMSLKQVRELNPSSYLNIMIRLLNFIMPKNLNNHINEDTVINVRIHGEDYP